jgi:hypothetical protein
LFSYVDFSEPKMCVLFPSAHASAYSMSCLIQSYRFGDPNVVKSTLQIRTFINVQCSTVRFYVIYAMFRCLPRHFLLSDVKKMGEEGERKLQEYE